MASRKLRPADSQRSAAVAVQAEHDELVTKLRSGELDREGFYDALVDRSVSHLQNRVTPECLEIVRERMREEVETNPVLVEMVRQALAGSPSTPAS